MIELKYIVPVITAILGLIGGHFFSNKRESEKRRKEMRIEYLVDAFRKLERGSSPTANDYSDGDFESAISDIQLLGNGKQVLLAHKFCEAASSGDGNLLQDLLENIRFELRAELALPKEELPRITPFRVIKNANKVNSSWRKKPGRVRLPHKNGA
jgi:hypothetical protein